MTLDCKNSSGWDEKKKNRKKQQQPFSLLVLQKTLIPKAAQLLFWCSRLWDFFPPLLLAPAFFVFFLNLHITRCDTVATILQNNTVVAFESREKMIIRCVDGGHSQAGSKIKASPRLVYVKKWHVTFWTTPPYDFHSSRSTPTFTLSACPLPRSPLSHLPEKRRGGWELPW